MSQPCIIRLGANTIYEGLPHTTTTSFSSTWYDKILINVGDRLRAHACVPNQPFRFPYPLSIAPRTVPLSSRMSYYHVRRLVGDEGRRGADGLSRG